MKITTKMRWKVVLNKPLWYNSVTLPPRIQTTYYVVKAQSTNPDKKSHKKNTKNRIPWKFQKISKIFGWYPGVWIADYVPNIGRHFDRERRHCPDHTRLCLNRSINSISRNFVPKSVLNFLKFQKTYSDRKVCQSIHLGKYKENRQLGWYILLNWHICCCIYIHQHLKPFLRLP